MAKGASIPDCYKGKITPPYLTGKMATYLPPYQIGTKSM
jgi:hypothetical protein